MPDNTPNDGPADAEGAGGTLSVWSIGWHKLGGRRILPPVVLASIQRLMPPLATRIWRQRDLFTRKRDRLAASAAEPTGITSSLTSRPLRLLTDFIPRLRTATTLSSVWPRLLDLTWLRRHRKQRNESLQRAKTSKEVRPDNDTPQWADILYPGEPQLIVSVAEEEVTAVDEDYPLIIRNLLSSPASRVKPNDTINDFFKPSYTTPTPFPDLPLANKPAISDSSGSMVSDISPISRRGISRANEIQGLNRPQVQDAEDGLVRTTWQLRHTYQSRPLDQSWPPLIQSLVPYRILAPQPAGITNQNTPWEQATLVQHRPHLLARLAEAEMSSHATTQPTYAASMPAVVVPDEETIQTEENDDLPLKLEKESNFPYFLPDFLPGQSQPTGYGKMMNRAGQSARSETKRSSSEPTLNSLPLNKQPASGLLGTGTIRQRAPEISQPGPLMSPQIRSSQTMRRRTEVTRVYGDLPISVAGQDTTTMAIPTNVRLSRTRQTGEVEISLLRRESLSAAGLRRQSPLVSDSVRRAPTLPYQPYPREITDTPVPDRSESREPPSAAGLRRQSLLVSDNIRQTPAPHYQPRLKPLDDTPARNRARGRSLIDNQTHQSATRKDNRQSGLEPPPVSAIEPKSRVATTQSGGTLPAIFERETRYTSQTMPELALAPVEQPAPVASPTPPTVETKAEEEAEGATTPDIDAIARDVYIILKRSLAREREQALGTN